MRSRSLPAVVTFAMLLAGHGSTGAAHVPADAGSFPEGPAISRPTLPAPPLPDWVLTGLRGA